MYLVMYVNEKPVESIRLFSNNRISQLVNTLKEKHDELIKQSQSKPVFMIEQVPSGMNHFELLTRVQRNQHSDGKNI